jgi:hypothetical protein
MLGTFDSPNWVVGRGFIPGKKPLRSARALAPEACSSFQIKSFFRSLSSLLGMFLYSTVDDIEIRPPVPELRNNQSNWTKQFNPAGLPSRC